MNSARPARRVGLVAVVLLLVAGVAAGCGGGGGGGATLTAEAYRERVRDVARDVQARTSAGLSLDREDALVPFLSALPATVAGWRDQVAALDPPPELAARHRALLAALDRLRDTAAGIDPTLDFAGDTSSANTLTGLIEAATAVRTSLDDIARTAIKSG